MPTFDVERFLRAIVEERIRVVTSVPAIFWYALTRPDIANFDLSGVGWATYGGAPIAPSLVHGIQRGFPNARGRLGAGHGYLRNAGLRVSEFGCAGSGGVTRLGRSEVTS